MAFDFQGMTVPDLIRAPLGQMSDSDAVACVAMLIDLSTDERSELGIERAFGMLKEISRRALLPAEQATLHYFRANAWAAKRIIELVPGPREWERLYRQEEILSLFLARNHEGFASLSKVRRCQILTNLGIQFNEVGRFVEAIELWDSALALLPNFAMANGSRGDGLKYYGLASEDRYDLEVLLLFARRSYAAATAKGALWDSIYPPSYKERFLSSARQIDDWLDLSAIEADLNLGRPSLGRSKKEQAYRRWCLQHRLFLNPLNDLGAHPIAASDHLLLPSLRVGIEETGMPPIIGLYSQMKQEYAFARLMLWEGQPDDHVHFADRRVRLSNTLDYPSFSMATEKTCAAFRLAYSILDKVGYLINIYWRLGAESHRVGFRSVWYNQTGDKPQLHDRLKGYENWPLHGLFWLSKDLFDDRFQRVTNPDAREIFVIRNHLEHKYLQVHEGWAEAGAHMPITSSIGHSISSTDLASKALRLLKMARAAMIYLPLAVHAEERRRSRDSDADGFVCHMDISTWNDDWKR
ncbi:MAG: LA2681 family HEPN domain-containing protein [Pseudomonadota bacterium]|nr:LA2681 family HEPN domain-containing protein [Pseudomonadota bacterium]